jgi:hypothetical protein
MVCYKKETTELRRCIFSTDKNTNPSNLIKHLKQHPQQEVPKLHQVVSQGKGKAHILPDNDISFDHIIDKSNVASIVVKQSAESVYDRYSRLVHKFFVRHAVSFGAANTKEFGDLIKYVADSGYVLKENTNAITIDKIKFGAISEKKINEMIYVIKKKTSDVRSFYKEQFGRPFPFLCVGHDVWFENSCNWLGITISFMCPVTWEFVSFPIGFTHQVKGKTVEIIVEAITRTLQR